MNREFRPETVEAMNNAVKAIEEVIKETALDVGGRRALEAVQKEIDNGTLLKTAFSFASVALYAHLMLNAKPPARKRQRRKKGEAK